MSDEKKRAREDTFEKATQDFIKDLPLIPLVGFVFAFCYEGAFFFALGISPSQILEIGDIIRSSAFHILPAIPLILLGTWSGSANPTPKGPSLKEKAGHYFDKGMLIFFRGTLYIMTALYLLLGVYPEVSVTLFIMAIFILAAPKFVFSLCNNSGIEIFMLVYAGLLCMTIFLSMGISDANEIRAGNREHFPRYVEVETQTSKEETKYILRRFTSGVLIGGNERDKIWFVSSAPKYAAEIQIDPEPYRGLLCYSFDMCWASGWASERSSKK